MDWLLFAAMLIGAVAGGFLVARNPSFWIGLGLAAVKAALPFIMARMPPEKEAAWNEYQRRNPSARLVDFERKWKREHERG